MTTTKADIYKPASTDHIRRVVLEHRVIIQEDGSQIDEYIVATDLAVPSEVEGVPALIVAHVGPAAAVAVPQITALLKAYTLPAAAEANGLRVAP